MWIKRVAQQIIHKSPVSLLRSAVVGEGFTILDWAKIPDDPEAFVPYYAGYFVESFNAYPILGPPLIDIDSGNRTLFRKSIAFEIGVDMLRSSSVLPDGKVLRSLTFGGYYVLARYDANNLILPYEWKLAVALVIRRKYLNKVPYVSSYSPLPIYNDDVYYVESMTTDISPLIEPIEKIFVEKIQLPLIGLEEPQPNHNLVTS